MSEINTFVFFDIETTGLPSGGPPKITELAFTACLSEHLLQTPKHKIPRALHKLLLPFHPQKVIHHESTRITGLDNLMLEHINKMDTNTVDLINRFLNQLKKPVCLVAHNGNKFDYPILARQLKNLNGSVDEDILCVDSLDIFKKLNEEENSNSAIDEFLNTNLADVQKRNEKTPLKGHSFASIARDSADKPKAAKCLFESPSTSTANGDVVSTQSVKPKIRISFALTEIFKRLHDKEPESAHNAEADTIHLMSCAIAIKDDFVKMANLMAVKFIDVKII